jgi:DNA-binding NarL/FixJ family response regulator
MLAVKSARRRASLARALEADDFEICCTTGDADDAVACAAVDAPDVALVDVMLASDGTALVDSITLVTPKTAVIVLTPSANDDELLAALRAGACGYLPATIEAPALVAAVRAVLKGEAALPRGSVARVVEELRVRHQRRLQRGSLTSVRLTDREWEVFELLNEGLTTREIARVLYVSPVTVRAHIAAVVKKLGVADREAALRIFEKS